MKRQKRMDDKVKAIQYRPTNTNVRPSDKTTQLEEARIVDGKSMMEEEESGDKHVILNRYITFHIIFLTILYDT